jgi:hypothetical protein
MDISPLTAMKNNILTIVVLFLVWACDPKLDYEIHGYSEKIIVEGFISKGDYPKVYLSLNVPLWQEVDSATILNKVVRTAKVTVSDGEETEILTSRWDKNHFPPFVYSGTELKGKAGKTYELTVEYSGYTLTSKTTIPDLATVTNIESSPVEGNDSLRVLSLVLEVDSINNVGYRLYSKKRSDDLFVETPVIYNENFNLRGKQTFLISPSPAVYHPSFQEGNLFLKGDTVFIKVCVIDSVATRFFKAFAINSLTGKDFFLSDRKALESNISTPGFGIWYGVAATQYLVKIE